MRLSKSGIRGGAMAVSGREGGQLSWREVDRIGPLETQVVRVISQASGPVSVRDVCDALERDGYFAYQGVLNCLNRLVKKGILERSKKGSVFIYQPLVDLEGLVAQVVSRTLVQMGGEPDRVICRVLGIDPDTGAQQIAELRQKVKALRRGARRR